MADAPPTFHVSTEDTGGEFALMEATVSDGGGPSAHYHRETTEVFFVLEGSMTVRTDEEERTLGPGESARVPPATVHSLTAPEDGRCRYLVLISPGELELLFREVATRRGEEGFPEDFHRVEELVAAVSDSHDLHVPPVEDSHSG